MGGYSGKSQPKTRTRVPQTASPGASGYPKSKCSETRPASDTSVLFTLQRYSALPTRRDRAGDLCVHGVCLCVGAVSTRW